MATGFEPGDGGFGSAACHENQLGGRGPVTMCPQLEAFGEMMNVRQINQAGQLPTFCYEDHRTAIIAIWAALQDGIFSRPPVLVRFDAHADVGELPQDWAALKRDMTSIENVMRIANSLRPDDGGWVKAALELGLISNVISFYVNDHTGGKHQEHCSHDGTTHQMIWLSKVRDTLSYQGDLVDRAKAKCLQDIYEAMSWDPDPRQGGFTGPAYWFDIDFDFATHRLPADFGSMPWRQTDFAREFDCNPLTYGHSMPRFLTSLLHHSRLLTMATEPSYSCGLAGACHIGRELEKIFEEVGFPINIIS
jgi:hypothetical protein